jgi:hypothetical protein
MSCLQLVTQDDTPKTLASIASISERNTVDRYIDGILYPAPTKVVYQAAAVMLALMRHYV